MDRDRSRSPRGNNYEEIVRLVVMREQARLTKDWVSADSIREKLTAAGVVIYDKTNSWKSSDGMTGRIPTWSELEAGQTPEAIIAAQEEKTMAVQQANGSDAHVKYLVQMREQARASKDWAQSDKLRDDLKALGVELFDKEKMWRSKTGSGVIIGYRGAQGPTDLEISTLVVQRERARQSSDYTTSDMIRDELKAAGVDINDREKMWRSNDGRQGPVPTWTAITGGAGETAPMLAPPAVAAPAVAQANAASLRNQVVQAALAAAQNPASAVRTLQLLQQAGGTGQPAPAKTLVRPAMPAMQMPAPAMTAPVAAPARTNAECQEALGFISQCQAQGRPPQDVEIDWLVGLREKFRQGRDFNSADELRNAMRSTFGVEMHEKEKKWTCTDGRQGDIPMWNALV